MVLFGPGHYDFCRWDPPSSLEIAGYLPSGSGVTHEDIIIVTLKINLTAGNANPLEKVSFFDSYGSNKKRGLRESDMTALTLQNNEVRASACYRSHTWSSLRLTILTKILQAAGASWHLHGWRAFSGCEQARDRTLPLECREGVLRISVCTGKVVGLLKQNLHNLQENKLRVYSKKSDSASKEAVTVAFEKYVKCHFGNEVIGTPCKKPSDESVRYSLTEATRKRKLFQPIPELGTMQFA